MTQTTTQPAELQIWEVKFKDLLEDYTPTDPSHDRGHFTRVWKMAKEISSYESKVDLLVVLAASYLHDYKSLPKNHPDRKNASRISGEQAIELLRSMSFPQCKLPAVFHAIEAHSFSSGVEPTTIEAKIVQDADRLEAMGAIGITRVFAICGHIGSMPFDPEDPLAKERPLDDQKYALDHYSKKIFLLKNQLKTTGGRKLGEERSIFVSAFFDRLVKEITL